MANHETRSFDCSLTESRCAEGECSLTYCVRREREDIAFRRRQEEKPFILGVSRRARDLLRKKP
jgi:hypothetical protein